MRAHGIHGTEPRHARCPPARALRYPCLATRGRGKDGDRTAERARRGNRRYPRGGASARIRCIAALLLASADSPHELGRDDLAEAAAIILDEVGEIERALTALRIRRDTPAENCGAI